MDNPSPRNGLSHNTKTNQNSHMDDIEKRLSLIKFPRSYIFFRIKNRFAHPGVLFGILFDIFYDIQWTYPPDLPLYNGKYERPSPSRIPVTWAGAQKAFIASYRGAHLQYRPSDSCHKTNLLCSAPRRDTWTDPACGLKVLFAYPTWKSVKCRQTLDRAENR